MSTQSFRGAKITTGSGGNGRMGIGGRGGDVGSKNKGSMKTQIFDQVDLTTGRGGDGEYLGKGGRGGDIGSKNRTVAEQDFTEAELGTGAGGSVKGGKGGRGGDIGSKN